jgi:hypothetical protein
VCCKELPAAIAHSLPRRALNACNRHLLVLQTTKLSRRVYSDGLSKDHKQSFISWLVAVTTLTIYTGWMHILLGLMLGSFFSRTCLYLLLGIWATTWLPAKPVLWSAFCSSWVSGCESTAVVGAPVGQCVGVDSLSPGSIRQLVHVQCTQHLAAAAVLAYCACFRPALACHMLRQWMQHTAAAAAGYFSFSFFYRTGLPTLLSSASLCCAVLLGVRLQMFKTWREYFSFSYLNEAELELGKR